MTFKVDPSAAKRMREEQQIGLQQAARILRKEEALRRIENLFGDEITHPALQAFLRDLVEEVFQ